MAHPLGTVLLDAATTAADNGKNTHYARLGDWDKPVKDLTERDAIKVAPDRKLNAFGIGSGQRTVNMTITLLSGAKYQLRIPDFATLPSESDKVNALADNGNWVLVTGEGTGDPSEAIRILRDGVPLSGDTLRKLHERLLATEAIIGNEAGDGDTLVSTVRELLILFTQYPEGVDLQQLLTLIHQRLDELEKRPAGGAEQEFTIAGITEQIGGFAGVSDYTGKGPDFWKKLLVKDYAPSVSLSADNPLRQKGAGTAVTLHFNVGQRTYPLQTVVVAGQAQLNGDGSVKLSGVVNANTAPNTNTDFSITATDTANKSTSTSVGIRYTSMRFWGGVAQDPATMSNSEISAALRALAGQELQAARQQTRDITLANQYPVFAWVEEAGNGSYTVNGLPNNAFLGRVFPFTNSDGFTENFKLEWGSKDTGTFTIGVN
jgi:hypothetical protein